MNLKFALSCPFIVANPRFWLPGRHSFFVPCLWVMLMTVLVCAVLPAGLPLTKTVGSAFSPSTTVVALKGRTEQVRGAVKRIVKGDPEPETGLTLPPAHQFFIIPDSPAAIARQSEEQASALFPFGIAQPLNNSVNSQSYPRGPPVT